MKLLYKNSFGIEKQKVKQYKLERVRLTMQLASKFKSLSCLKENKKIKKIKNFMKKHEYMMVFMKLI
jgi:hypothetical protein